jgi:hypothetical protein
MYWPLIGGLIAFVLVCLLMGWIMDAPNQRDDAEPPRGRLR